MLLNEGFNFYFLVSIFQYLGIFGLPMFDRYVLQGQSLLIAFSKEAFSNYLIIQIVKIIKGDLPFLFLRPMPKP